jgi:hypothetical protein
VSAEAADNGLARLCRQQILASDHHARAID